MQYWQEEMKWDRMKRDFGGDFTTYKFVEESLDGLVGLGNRKFYENYDHQLADHVHFSTVDDPNTVEIDNASSPNETRLAIIAGNRSGTFLEMTQCIAELGLGIRRALVACGKGEGPSKRSDWFYDNFWVYDRSEATGQVLSDAKQRTLEKALSLDPGDEQQPDPDANHRQGHTIVELSGRDRPGLLKLVADELQKQNLDIRSLAVWTQQVRKLQHIRYFAAFVLTVGDVMGPTITHANAEAATKRVEGIRERLQELMGSGHEIRASVSISQVKGPIHHDRRLHRLLFRMEERVLKAKWEEIRRAPPDNVERGLDDGRYCYNQDKPAVLPNGEPWVSVTQMEDGAPWDIHIKCMDRLKLAFDIATALADLGLDVIGARMDRPEPAPAAQGAPASASGRAHEVVTHLYQVLPAEGDPDLQPNDWRAYRIYDMLMNALKRRHPIGSRVHLENSEGIAAMAGKLVEADLTIMRARVNPFTEGGNTRTHTLYLLRNDGHLPTAQELKDVSSRHLGGTMTVDHDTPGSVDSASLTSGSLTYGIKDIESQWSGVAASPSPSSGSRSSLLGRHS